MPEGFEGIRNGIAKTSDRQNDLSVSWGNQNSTSELEGPGTRHPLMLQQNARGKDKGWDLRGRHLDVDDCQSALTVYGFVLS